MTANVTRLPCATYRTDIPASLRGMADQIESGELPVPELMVMVTTSKDGIDVFSQGIRADDDVFTIGLLNLGKDRLIAAHLSEDAE